MDAARFFDPATHGYLRVAVAVPRIRVADPVFNAAQTIALYTEAAATGAAVVAFPELGLSAYTCDDLFHQRALLDACEAALLQVAAATADHGAVAIVGVPVRVDHGLYNCAAVLHGGRVLGIVPKTYLPNYGEFYEARQFQPADQALSTEVTIGGQAVPFGALLFQAANRPELTLHVEICEDLWTPIPPSSHAALAGATVLVNLSASNITVGKAGYRQTLVAGQSARCLAAYLYSSAGAGESTTDLAWDGQALICENGELLKESERFSADSHWISADVDVQRLTQERMRQTSFGQQAARLRAEVARFRRVSFELAHRPMTGTLQRRVERFPYVPADPARRDERCREVYDIQVQALTQRLQASGIRKLVIGVSGGLDSTHALLVAAQAMDRLGLPRMNILGVTMPGYATSTRTLDQALRLMAAIGCSAQQIDIRPSCELMLKDIDHPVARGEPVYDVTFENVQAGERTSHLFRLANRHHALVAGTGDLSELALGWCTYGVGDHMAHYNLNASVPKTLIRHLVRWVADQRPVQGLDEQGSAVLRAILDTEVSPELVPGRDGADGPSQSTESQIGPYALHDFSLYQVLRFGYAPTKVAYLAWVAWHDRHAGAWPDGLAGPELVSEGDDVRAEAGHVQYTLAEIKRHLRTFADRFFRLSQYKRSVAPNSAKVGSGGSLSPRGDWRAPSDAEAAVWIAEVERIPEG